MNAIHTDNAPAAIGPYSQAIEVNGFVFASGQIPIDPAAMNEVYAEFFSQPYPARSAVAVEKLPKGALVEVEVLAAK